MRGKHIELPKESYVGVNDILEKYDHSPITEMQRVVEKIMIERAQKVDSAILGEIQQIAVENGIETKIFLNERNVAEALRNYQDGYAHIKAEVVREVFEEIEYLIWQNDTHTASELLVDIAKFKKKYTEGER